VDGGDRSARTEVEARRALRPYDAYFPMVRRAGLPYCDGGRPAAAEAGALQFSAQVAGLPQDPLGDFDNGTHGSLREARPRGGRARFAALPRPVGKAHLRECVERGVAGLAQTPDDARKRESALTGRCARAEVAR